MERTVEEFEKQLGPLTGPKQHANYCEFVGRQLGKTEALVKALPEDGNCVILVHNLRFAKEIERVIRERRHQVNYKNIIYITPKMLKEGYPDRLRGKSVRPVFVDNAVLDEMVWYYYGYVQDQCFPNAK